MRIHEFRSKEMISGCAASLILECEFHMISKRDIFFVWMAMAGMLTPIFVFARTPNDPGVTQWSYEDTGAFRAWDKATGSKKVVVAVIDNGFDQFHPDLLDNVWKNQDEIENNGIDDDKNGYIDDVWGWNFVQVDLDGDGRLSEEEARGNNDPRPDSSRLTAKELEDGTIHHGTLVAGIIGAVGNNQKDGAGLNWNVRLMNIKVVDNGGSGSLMLLPKAIRYAVDNGADVINLSLIGSTLPNDLPSAIAYAYEKGTAIISAAGNDSGLYLNANPLYPICIDAEQSIETVLGVSAIGRDRKIAQFSNVGDKCVDIAAPGVDITSTLRFSPTNGLKERFGGNYSGTSFAAPFVTAAAALVKSIQPSWGAAQIYEAILSTVHHTSGQDEAMYANLFGAGLVQIDKAVQYAIDRLKQAGGKSISTNETSGAAASKNQIMSISLAGFASQYELGKSAFNFQPLSSVEGIDNAASYVDNGKLFFVTTKRISDKKSVVSFYNKNWAFIKSWHIDGIGAAEINIADVAGDEKAEIIITPMYPDKELFRVYNLNGTELKKVIIDNTHFGVSAGFVDGGSKDRVAILYDDGSGLSIVEFNQNFDSINTVKISFPAKRGILGAGDIDGDGEEEYIVGSREGEDSYIGYYEKTGELKRRFFAYDSSFQGGVDIGIIDADGDGKDDIVVSPRDGKQPTRIWNYRSKKLEQWEPRDGSVHGMRILVY